MISSISKRLTRLSTQIIRGNSSMKTINNVDYEPNDGGMMKIALNKPKALNALSLQMIHDIVSIFPHIQKSKAFWIQGTGGKAFCAGGDVRRLYDAKILQNNLEENYNFFRSEFILDYKLSQMKSVQIANWDGIVMGGGVGISAFSPFIIATENSMYAMPEAKIGFFTDVGAGYFLSRLRNNLGYYLGMTGNRLKGQDVFVAGLANYYIPREKIGSAYAQLQAQIKNTADTKGTIKKILQKYHQKPTKARIQNQDRINQIFGKGSVKQIYETLKSSNGEFQKNILKTLQEQCPFSVHVIHKSIKLSKDRSIKQCFQQDFTLCQNFVNNNDFYEGVRCVLVNKGDTPKWKHRHLLDVQQKQVDKFFQNVVRPDLKLNI